MPGAARRPGAKLIALILLSGPIPSGGAERWTDLPAPPTARQEVAVAELNGAVYVIGGILEDRGATAIVERYLPRQRRWEPVKELPRALHHIGAASLGGRLFTVGGLDDSFQGVDSCFAYDPEMDVWEPVAPLPTRRGATGVAVLGGKIFAAGGQRGTTVAEFACFTPGAGEGSWEELPPMPTARNHLAAVASGGFLYAISGRSSGLRGEVERYDPVAREWTPRAPIPTPRGGIAAAAVGTSIYVFGGEGNDAVPSGVFGETERYDTEANQWSARARMSIPRHGIGAAVVGDLVFIPCGSVVEGFGVTDAHTAYEPPPEDLPRFRRGDVSLDAGVDISDAIRILITLFIAGGTLGCADAGDINDDGVVDIADPIRLLNHLFLGEPPPAPPLAAESGDPTPDLLDCQKPAIP
jgi:N-acetylneuraminic acid mutarotase